MVITSGLPELAGALLAVALIFFVGPFILVLAFFTLQALLARLTKAPRPYIRRRN